MGYPPIAVMSFNRPDKLKAMLDSLSSQRDAKIENRRIILFQDGAVNKYSRIRYTDNVSIDRCVEVFSEVFPGEEVRRSPTNIGVCENYERAENFLFDELRVDCAYFFEDDLVLSPAYLKMLDAIRSAARNLNNIAYFAAYGDYYGETPEAKDPHAQRVFALDHHWGFGLFARHRAAIRERIEPYLRIVLGTDYARRNHRAVYDMYESLGSCPRGTSQDAAKARASASLGYWRCNTVTPFARYEGDVGAHMNKTLYRQIGFERVRVRDGPLELAWPQKPEIAGFVAAQRELFREIARSELATLRSGLPRFLNPMRPCTHSDIEDAYRLLLGRAVEGESIHERQVGPRTVFEFVRALAASPEFEGLSVSRASDEHLSLAPISTDEIKAVYRLLLHREPEESDVSLAHASRISVNGFCRSKLRSEECKTLWSQIEP